MTDDQVLKIQTNAVSAQRWAAWYLRRLVRKAGRITIERVEIPPSRQAPIDAEESARLFARLKGGARLE